MKQRWLLRDHCNGFAQLGLDDLGDVDPINTNFAAVEIVETLNELDEGRLPRPRRR
jgi:hypothetical protein